MTYQIKGSINDLITRIRSNPEIRLLCIDPGQKQIGIAIGHFNSKVITPHKTIKSSSILHMIKIIDNICKDYGIFDIVLGAPLQNGMIHNKNTQKHIERVAALLEEANYSIYFQDESFSSCIAYDALSSLSIKRKKRDAISDSVAASVILQNFFSALSNDF